MYLYIYNKLLIAILHLFNLDNEEATQGFAYYTNRAVNDMLQNLNASAENWLLQHFRYIFNDGNITWWQIVQVSYFKDVLPT